MKIAILADHTIRGIQWPEHEWHICEYDKILDTDSILKFNPDAVLISIFNPEMAQHVLYNAALQFPIFVHTIPWQINSEKGRLEFNASLEIFNVVDLDALVCKHGANKMYDYRTYYLADMLFNSEGMELVRNQFQRALRAHFGKRKKCLIVDLDNTLWAGLLADGIEITKAHKAFQKGIKKLIDTGIILAICSKNDEQQALSIFENHPDMILKKEDLAAWRINWIAKSQNICEIAEELNIGLDSMAFLDDSFLEREEVKSVLPEVLVPEMPSDFADYPEFLCSIEEFDTFEITDVDKTRNLMYVQDRERKGSSISMSRDQFLHSLKTQVYIRKMDETTIDRVAQLSERTNQFNINGNVISKSSLQNLEAYTLTSEDKFGTHGIVGACVLDNGTIVGLYVSCRILGHGIEQAFLSHFYPSPMIVQDTGKNKAAMDFIQVFQAGIPEWISLHIE